MTNLAGSMASTAVNDPFNVEIGIADATQSNLAVTQQVRAGSSGFTITVSNANSAAAQLVGSDSLNQQVTAQTITVRINAGQTANTSGALQRLEFDPSNALTASTGSSVNAANPDTISTTAATLTVVVTAGSGC
jgi:hypothetical protein